MFNHYEMLDILRKTPVRLEESGAANVKLSSG